LKKGQLPDDEQYFEALEEFGATTLMPAWVRSIFWIALGDGLRTRDLAVTALKKIRRPPSENPKIKKAVQAP